MNSMGLSDPWTDSTDMIALHTVRVPQKNCQQYNKISYHSWLKWSPLNVCLNIISTTIFRHWFKKKHCKNKKLFTNMKI